MSTIWHHRDNHSRWGCVLPSDPSIVGYENRTFHSEESRDYCASFHEANAFGTQNTDVGAKIAAGMRPDWMSAPPTIRKDIHAN